MYFLWDFCFREGTDGMAAPRNRPEESAADRRSVLKVSEE